MKTVENRMNMLCSALKKGHLNHAYLISGEYMGGQNILAYNFSKFILCGDENKLEKAKPCNSCESCRLIDAGTHPDFELIRPDNDKTVISKENIDNLIKLAYKKPFYGKKSVYILEECSNMSISSSNALLKILEEPPEYVMFFLTTSRKNMLLDTILSRVINIEIPFIGTDELYSDVQNDFGKEEFESIYRKLFYLPGLFDVYKDIEDKEDLKSLFFMDLSTREQLIEYFSGINTKKYNSKELLIYRSLLIGSFYNIILKEFSVYSNIALVYDFFDMLRNMSDNKLVMNEFYALSIKYFKSRLRNEKQSFIIEKIFKILEMFNEFERFVNVNYSNLLISVVLELEETH